MIDLIKKNPEYLKMAIEAIEFAKNRFTNGDYIRFCKSRPRTQSSEGAFAQSS